ncbi:MAG: tRNA pseudouridine(38-40) synthase TruA [Proteobacteria bacterium]|nr:tRNA pseudouridine(38-40) synthase TruA [Pseudomonadota bacterium]
MRWRLVIEYEGTDYVGWQAQQNGRSVQVVLEEALASLFQSEIRVMSSGRTDAGVHALCQVAAFDAEAVRTPSQVVRGLSNLLPSDVACVAAAAAPDDFDPRRWVRRKSYRYVWVDREATPALRRRFVWHIKRPLDVQAMAAASAVLVGRHDFSSFRAARCNATHAVRILEEVSVRRVGDEVHFVVVGNGFLRHMVRIVAGSLLQVGLGRFPPTWMADVLEARDRNKAGLTAPAAGLTLIEVEMGDRPRPWKS